jgi:hypothetical protein
MHKGGGNVKVPVNFLVPGTSTGASFNFGIFLENSSDDHSLFGPSAVPEPFLTQRALLPCCDPQQSTRSSCVHCFTQAVCDACQCRYMRSFHSILVLFHDVGPPKFQCVWQHGTTSATVPFQLPRLQASRTETNCEFVTL